MAATGRGITALEARGPGELGFRGVDRGTGGLADSKGERF
jgi:hypothetical protein